MKLFGRKKQDQEEEKEDSNSRTRTFSKKEEPKDNNSFKAYLKKTTPKKKDKGEIEIWTKKQRMFVVIIFLSTAIGSGVIAANAREWKLPNLPRLSMPKVLSDETIVIEGSGTKSVMDNVRNNFFELTNKLSGIYGFFVIRLSDSSFVGVNEKEIFEAASLNKLPVMVAMYKEAEKGNINLSSVYVLKDEDKVAGAGSLASMPAGTRITYEELVRRMGHESDNTAFNICRKILGDDAIYATMDEFNLPRGLLSDNEATPYDIAYFFKSLLDAKKVSRETRDAIIEDLTGTIYEDWIAKGIPAKVAHKFGTLPHVRNDAGVVLSSEPYILVVMSRGIVESEADVVIPEFSKEVFTRLDSLP